MIGFQLGREYKLSVAEIFAVFPNGKTHFLNTNTLIIDNVSKEEVLKKADRLGGTIKIMEFKTIEEDEIQDTILDFTEGNEGKFKYGISIFGEKKSLKDILNKTKKLLKENDISSRFVNKDFNNLSSAQILGEKLVDKNTDFTLIYDKDVLYFGNSIWVQDINKYSERDYEKDRDMHTGMLPPKLAQMMINLSNGSIIYDPFVGLGTVLIESIVSGNTQVYGSDINEIMVTNTSNNLKKYPGIQQEIIKLNAKFIEEAHFLSKIDAIVSEGYLGEIMTQKNISKDRIDKQIDTLVKIYEPFFQGLKKVKYKGSLVISFPFWEMKGKFFYFNDIYDILLKYCNIESLLSEDLNIQPTKAGSLLYKRDKQLVGREIFKLTIK